MSLSEHDKTQFELLTADLILGGSILKEVAKRERANTMSYVALPSRAKVLMVLILANFCFFVNGILTQNVTLTNATGAIGGLLAAAVIVGTANKISAIKPKPTASRE